MTSGAQEFKEYVERRLASLEDVVEWRRFRRFLIVFLGFSTYLHVFFFFFYWVSMLLGCS